MAEGRIPDLARLYYDSFEKADRAAMENLLADNFTFTSPYDDHISRSAWFERCWPFAGSFGFERPMRVFAEGDEALVQYSTRDKKGGTFANAELLRFEGDRIADIQVYFGFVPDAEIWREEDEAQIRALIGERVEAMRAKDSKRAMATLADDVVTFELAPPLALGPEQARDEAGLEAWFAGWSGPVVVDFEDLRIEHGGNVAFARSLNRMRGTRPDGREVDFWMRSTLGFRRTGEGWKIAHGHTSVPFYMDGSFRAALELKPD
jgi:ketosteroid isomerase-like protein